MPEGIARLWDAADAPHPAALEILTRIGFPDAVSAWRRLRAIAGTAPVPRTVTDCLSKLAIGLGDTPSPDQALLNFERFLGQVPSARPMLEYLAARPRAIEILLKLFVGSQYLTETLLRSPIYLDRLTQHRALADLKSREEFIEAALQAVGEIRSGSAALDGLRRYQRWEILRIGACDSFGLMDLRSVTVQLSLLADSLLQVAMMVAAAEQPAPTPIAAGLPGFCVLGLGKLGGEELNYSSDIDLIFLVEDQAEAWVPFAQRLIRVLQTATGEGFLYRVDMRLRPWGRSGALVSSAGSFLEYLGGHAEQWERQALLKARVVAGDQTLGRRVLHECQRVMFHTPEPVVREAVRSAKQKIEAALIRKGQHWGEVKSGTGSLRDIEFLVQYLQLTHGQKQPQVRSANTLDALVRLADHDLIHADEYRALTTGYIFLRTIEHTLQLAHNKQTHLLPTEARELNFLARKLDFEDGPQFVAHYERHCQSIRAVFDRHLGDAAIRRSSGPAETTADLGAFAGDANAAGGGSSLASRVPLQGSPFSSEERQQHRLWFQDVTPEKPMRVIAELREGPTWRVTILGLDEPGDLSMSCGLLFVYGFNILDGLVTTGLYPDAVAAITCPGADVPASGPAAGSGRPGSLGGSASAKRPAGRTPRSAPRKTTPKGTHPTGLARDFVNVFTVRPPLDVAEPDVWISYEADLLALMRLSRTGQDGEAQGRLAGRVAAALEGVAVERTAMAPLDVRIDNERLAEATVLEIRADDTMGFLYELTNALALSAINIDRVVIQTDGPRIFDTLAVTDAATGGKLADPLRLQQLQAAVVLIKHFTHLLPRSPHPESALLHFRSLLRDLFQQPHWMDTLSSLDRPEVLDALTQVLGAGDFLWDDFLRLQSMTVLPMLRDASALQHAKSRDELAGELARELAGTDDRALKRRRLNDFKDREMFRIDLRHILGHIAVFNQFSAELTDVAEVVIEATLQMVQQELEQRHGMARDRRRERVPIAACVLGKCGGRELGFASDIELLFIYEQDGQTDGPEPVSNATFFARLVERFAASIQARKEGIFHIDLRLRPYGSAGQLAVSLAAFQQYYAPDGPAWPYERQALVKLRPVAGDAALRAQIMTLRDQFLYTGQAFDSAALVAMRERQVRQLVKAGTFHAKLSEGGLVDAEYLVQALQLAHGQRHPSLRTTNTYDAAVELARLGVLNATDGAVLCEAYVFFRRLIDALRMVRGNAQDLTVPDRNSEEFDFLARRLGMAGEASQLQQTLRTHVEHVCDLLRRHLPRPGLTGS